MTVQILSAKLLALATLLQSVEMLQMRAAWSETGIWRWSILRKDFNFLPSGAHYLLDRCLDTRGFHALLWIRAMCSLFILGSMSSTPHANLFGLLFLTTWLIAVRWRGTFNGGSDSMTALIALALWVGQSFPAQAWVGRASLAYIAVQVTASYFLAGWAKIKNPAWRKGKALTLFLRLPGYDTAPDWVRVFLNQPLRAKLAGWGVILFELSSPVAWLDSRLCLLFLGAALFFHLICFLVLGLNRFFFAWLAAYPALYFWSQYATTRLSSP